MLFIACLVRLTSPGPALFRQLRVGRGGQLFEVIKFRSMAETKHVGSGLTTEGDSRVTPVGAFLRRLKLDELPQFYNVLKGDMSVVGPRPKLPQFAAIPKMPYRPGITGLASIAFRCEDQILGSVPPERVEHFYEERIMPLKANLDVCYMCNATPASDARVIAATVLSVNNFSGAAESVSSAPTVDHAELPVDSWHYRYVKRMLDVVGGLVALTVFLIPGILIGLVLLIGSPLPVFYSEERVGRYGVPFRIWKFRSMCPHSPLHGHAHRRMVKRGHDPRVTPIGRFLRRWSLDELPQLINVLRGDMSLVGPRPIVEAETFHYKHLLSFYLAAMPGLSGLWQVSGRSDIDYDGRAKLDASYVKNWSLGNDLRILLRTIPAVLRRVGAR